MAKVEIVRDATSMDYIINIIEKQFTVDALAAAIDLAKHELAQKIWDEHRTEIMAKMDMNGLANLIAVYAAKDFQPKTK